MVKYYLNTSIWRDYFENRSDKFRPLGEWAYSLIKMALENGCSILYSDLVVDELKIKYSLEEINGLLGIAGDLLVRVDISKSQVREAASLCKQRKVAFGDALYAILARDNNAIMVTRDIHFLELADIVCVKKPEELI